MAEGFARAHAKGRVEVRSAGTSSMGYVNADTVEAMAEVGVDITTQTSKQLKDEALDWADVVVTLGCCSADNLCPVTFKGAKLDWQIEDPLGRPPVVIRRVRDDIERRVKALIAELTGA